MPHLPSLKISSYFFCHQSKYQIKILGSIILEHIKQPGNLKRNKLVLNCIVIYFCTVSDAKRANRRVLL